ncbi:zinc-binding A33-like protein [Labeo rohita]|uniref:Zinc-binding A33-like protein n=1 Tax=Labeo rohita TaxID=84645 RepID=A0A498NGS7_LABRO|nr:zinc-binding A33-like protein [Labeo rohita]
MFILAFFGFLRCSELAITSGFNPAIHPTISDLAVLDGETISYFIKQTNRKKAEAHKTGGGPAPPPLTNAEEMALSLNTGRPVAEGIPAGCSSEPVTPQDTSAYIKYSEGNICLLEPPVLTEPQAVDVGDDDTISADTERPIETVEEQEEEEEGPSTTSVQMNTVQ